MSTPDPILKISDGVTTLNLLDKNGLMLASWTPNVLGAKSNATIFTDSPLSEGRRLAYRQWGNVTDVFSLKARGHNEDDAIRRVQELRRLLEKGLYYWLNTAQNSPVYLIARGPKETETRYAVIVDYKNPSESNPYTQPSFGSSLIDELSLAIEHLPWTASAPGEAVCVEISAQQVYAGGAGTTEDNPGAPFDDVYAQLDTGTGVGNVQNSFLLIVGKQTVAPANYQNDIGIRFTSVNIAAGSTILRAYIELVSGANKSGHFCNTKIYGNDVDDASTFSNYADYTGRALTSAFVDWRPLPELTTGEVIRTPDITSIIQEIIDRGGWASGNDIAILIKDNGSSPNANRAFAAYDDYTLAAPKLVIEYATSGDADYGQEATCESGAVFITNKHNRAALTNIFLYDHSGTSYTELLGDATPYALLPATPTQHDAVYFGSTDGPFGNLIFDISTAQVDLTTVYWEFYNGATWANLTVQDNTATTDAFDRTGVHSVHWVQPSNWATVAVNGVTAYWVRARVDVVGASPTPPSQGNRDVYTAVWPFVELQAAQVAGDIPALARILAVNQSDSSQSGAPVLHTNRLIIGSRSLDRGENYTPYLNISDEQNPSGVTVTLGANTAYANDPTTPTGRRAAYTSPAAAGTTTEATITLGAGIAPEYLGRFRAFLRYKYHTGSADAVSMRLITTPGGSGLARYSEYVFPQVNTDWQTADFGIIEIPPRAPGDTYGTITFAVSITRDTAGRVVYLYDLVLMPVDEWATDAVDKSGLAARAGAIGDGDMLDFDSVTYPRQVDQAILRRVSDGRMIGYFQNRQPGPALLQANRAQRLWFFAMMYEASTELSSPIAISHTIQAFAVQRYLSRRGAR